MHGSDPNRDVDLVCLSRHRWRDAHADKGAECSRTQHLMVRFAKTRRVFFIEEAVRDESASAVARVEQRVDASGVHVVVPHLPYVSDAPAALTMLLRDVLGAHDIRSPIAWYDTPLFLAMTRTLPASVVVYDCMQDLSSADAPLFSWLESELFSRAHVVFVGARSLHEVLRARHPNVHVAASAADVDHVAHFARARAPQPDPVQQAALARPRVGFVGALDERVDVELVRRVAALRPAWSIVLLGPIVDRARAARLTQGGAANVHVLGAHSHDDVPRFLAGWDVALLPYAAKGAPNESQRRAVSEPKVLECLAAGLPVVATAVPDIATPYGDAELVDVVDNVDGEHVVAAIERALAENAATDRTRRWRSRDLFLATMSWDSTFEGVLARVEDVRPRRAR